MLLPIIVLPIQVKYSDDQYISYKIVTDGLDVVDQNKYYYTTPCPNIGNIIVDFVKGTKPLSRKSIFTIQKANNRCTY